jgi:hypothetical protein
MIDRLFLEDSLIHVHVVVSSLETTKNFTCGGLVIDLKARTAAFGRLPPVAIPDGLPLADGAVLNLQLVAPDGT